MNDVRWPDVLGALLRREDLSRSTAQHVMDIIMSGDATPAQIAGFAIALRGKGETAQEVLGLIDSMLAHAVPLAVDGPTLDVVGTGGDQANTVNISTMAALVAASCGARVVKHGNRSASSMTGTADVLEELGVAISLAPQAVSECVDTVGIGFAFAPTYHPALRFAGPPRRELGVPTVFNILGPLANPARPTSSLIGCADARLAPVQAEVLHAAGMAALVVRGRDGLDEVSPFVPSDVWDATGDEVTSHVFDPVGFCDRTFAPDALRGGDRVANAAILRDVLAGKNGGNLDAIAFAVAVNAGFALAAYGRGRSTIHGDLMSDIEVGFERARTAISEGAPLEILQRWASLSQSLADIAS